MTVAHQSLLTVNRFVLAGLLATASVGAIAQTAASPQGDAGATASSPQAQSPGQHMGRYDPAQMQAYMAKRQTDMKAKLKITPAQDGAWTAFTAAMHPPTSMMGSRPGAEFDKLTTPQRIDKMRELRTERIAEMDKRMDATKTFYAALNAEQQKVFDTEHATRGRHHGGGHGGSYGGGHGGGHHGGMEHGKS